MDLISPAMSINLKSALPRESRIVTAINICKYNEYVIVSTCTEESLHSPSMHLLRICLPSNSSSNRARGEHNQGFVEKLLPKNKALTVEADENLIKVLDELPLNNLPRKLSDKKSSYVYDVNCAYYGSNLPIFVGF